MDNTPHTRNLLILDIDGVLTDGTKLYDANGVVVGKSFADHDWTAIKKFQKDGWVVCLLSADKNVNLAVAKERGIDFWNSRDDDGKIDKVKWLAALMDHYRGHPISTVYVGDDLFDIPIMRELIKQGGKAYCPNNANPFVKKVATTLSSDGGHGAIMSLYCLYSDDDSQPCG